MTTITTHAQSGYSLSPNPERVAHRYTGILVATAASILLWAGIGTGIWGLVALFG